VEKNITPNSGKIDIEQINQFLKIKHIRQNGTVYFEILPSLKQGRAAKAVAQKVGRAPSISWGIFSGRILKNVVIGKNIRLIYEQAMHRTSKPHMRLGISFSG